MNFFIPWCDHYINGTFPQEGFKLMYLNEYEKIKHTLNHKEYDVVFSGLDWVGIIHKCIQKCCQEQCKSDCCLVKCCEQKCCEDECCKEYLQRINS